ncbi:hypothetical protein EDC02_7631 [Micromonospora sp. Llam0]|uniref:hypothetical protein n=1 Tax=Micromonospora sp. Llam0 TaxID=2485143 RepID=UPI000F49C1AD|nr:hypothetical protein [Micromonospora sp. Llam0]ROO52691.1 hypothetical protein EDC02_7631 [Micromonospora sp. Llam0]
MTINPSDGGAGRHSDDEDQADALAAVQSMLGGFQVEIRTAGELAALMGRLPADTPISVAGHARVDRDLALDEVEDRTAAVATTIPMLMPRNGDPAARIQECTPGPRTTAGVQLGAVVVAEDAEVAPERTKAFCPYWQAVEAKHDDDAAGLFDAHNEMLTFVAETLEGDVEAILHEWVPDDDLREQMRIEGQRLRHTVDRLTALGAKVNTPRPG